MESGAAGITTSVPNTLVFIIKQAILLNDRNLYIGYY